jgi:hypothetical protein
MGMWLAACAPAPVSSPNQSASESSLAGQSLTLEGDSCDRVEITEIIGCNSDELCPCGSHCKDMVCGQDCMTHAQCGTGGICDILGHCTTPAETPDPNSPEPPVDTTPTGDLVAMPTQQFVVPGRDVYHVTLAAERLDVPSLRVTAGEGSVVRCQPDEDFAASCELGLTVQGDPVQLSVRILPHASPAAGAADLRWSVRAFIKDQPTILDFIELAPPAEAAAPTEGVYEGFATATLTGTQADAVFTSASIGDSLRVPLRMRVFPNPAESGGYRVNVEDPWTVFASGGAFDATISSNANARVLSTGLIEHLGVSTPASGDLSLRVSVAGDVRLGPSSLSGNLRVVSAGFAAGKELRSDWQVTLRRTANLPAGATFQTHTPAVARTPEAEQQRVNTLLPWSAAALGVMGPPRAIYEAEDAGKIDQLLKGFHNARGLFDCEWDAPTTLPAYVTMPAIAANSICALSNWQRFVNDAPAQRFAYHILRCQLAAGSQLADKAARELLVFDPDGPTGRPDGTRAPVEWSKFDRAKADYGCNPVERNGARACSISDYRARPTASQCTQRYTCYRRPESGYALAAAGLGNSAIDKNGDLRCADGKSSEAFGLFGNLDAPADKTKKADQMLAACVADLGRAVPGNVTVNAQSLQAVYTSNGCVDLARFHRALDWATMPARRRLAGIEEYDAAADAQAHRLLQQWLTVHMFVAREGVAERSMSELTADLTLSPGEAPLVPASMSTLLARLEAGWDVFLHPRTVTGLLALDARVLANPDYRPRTSARLWDFEPHHEQGTGISSTIMETMQAHLNLLDEFLINESYSLGGLTNTARARLAAALKRYVVARGLATALNARVRAQLNGNPLWQARFDTAAKELNATLTRVLVRASDLERKANPLGIEADDLPLYFSDVHNTPGTRFTALTTYLSTGAESAAEKALSTASDAVRAAKDSWMSVVATRVQEKRDRLDSQDRVLALKREYGRAVVELCGARPGLSAENALDTQTYDGDTCFYDDAQNECRFDASDVINKLGSDDLRGDLCTLAVLRKNTGLSLSLGNANLDAAIDGFGQAIKSGTRPNQALASVTLSDDKKRLVIGNTSYAFASLRKQPSDMDQVRNNDASQASAACLPYFAGRQAEAAVLGSSQSDALEKPQCYLGTLGQDALAVRAASSDIQLARSHYAEFTERYDIAMRGCLIQERGAIDLNAELDAHSRTMKRLYDRKRAMETAAAFGSFFSSLGSMLSPKEIAEGGVVFGGIGAGTLLVASLELADINHDISMAEVDHQAQMERIRLRTQIDTCYNDAGQQLVGLRTAGIQIERAGLNLTTALAQFTTHKRLLAATQEEGRAVIAREQNRVIPGVGHDFWVSSNLKQADFTMRLARRAVFLATRAATYEFQLREAGRQLEAQVLSAKSPNALGRALANLNSYVATNMPRGAGSIAAQPYKTYSLRDDILRLAEREDIPGVTKDMTLAQRFRLFIRAQRFAHFNDRGAYDGQLIPFSLAPYVARAGTAGQGIGLPGFANQCAERIWSVNLAPQGAGLNGNRSFVDLELRKLNNFYSKWCLTPGANDPPYQVASVNPQKNLFRDPVFGNDHPEPVVPKTRFALAHISAQLNVGRAVFDGANFEAGRSLQLAARGLFGDYALFIPQVVQGEGLRLEKVEDILLRFDYVAGARPQSNVRSAGNPTLSKK